MPRLFLSSLPALITPDLSIKVSGEDARYLSNVLRLKRGDSILVTGPEGGSSGSGQQFRAEVLAVRRGEVKLGLFEAMPVRKESGPRLILVQGLLKGAKMDMVVQKAVELGVSGIVPVVTSRSQVRHTRKLDRWRKIALEATRQCGRQSAPEVRAPVDFSEFLDSAREGLKGFLFYEEASKMLSTDESFGPSEVHVVIGPEGGFSRPEVEAAVRSGLSPRGLGDNILRAETASIVSLALVQFLLGARL